VKLDRDYHAGRDDLWYPVDWDRDGNIDLLAGVSDWRDYGWDDAFNEKRRVDARSAARLRLFPSQHGTNEQPALRQAVRVEPVDQYGSPSPNPVDWFGRGRWDLIAGSFLDSITLFRNSGNGLLARRAGA
jgi:hypothetical protein